MKRIQSLTFILFVAGAFLSNVDTQAAHVDIAPYFVGRTNPDSFTEPPSALKTGSFDLAGGSEAMLLPDNRVFMGTANNYATGPGWVSTIDPGWGIPSNWEEDPSESYPAGTSVPLAFGSLSYNVVVDPRLGRNLSYWDGTGAPNFGPVPAGEVLRIELPSGAVTLDGSATAQPGTEIKSSLTSYNLHVHWIQKLYANDPFETYDPSDTVTEGFYLFSVNAQVDAPTSFGTLTSEPLYILMAHGFEKYAYEIVYGDQLQEPRWLRDEHGDPLMDDDYNWIPELDSEGNVIYDLVFDEFGNPVLDILAEIEHIAPEMQLARDWVQNNLVAPVPEPASATLIGAAALAMTGRLRRRR